MYKLPGRDEEVVALQSITMKTSHEIYPILRGEFVVLRGPSGGGACLCAMTYLYVWHDLFKGMIRGEYVVLRGEFVVLHGPSEGRACKCAMIDSYVWHD